MTVNLDPAFTSRQTLGSVGRSRRFFKPVYSSEKPLLLSFPKWEADKRRLINEALGTNGLRGSALTSELRRQGYDGVILDYSPVGYHQKEVMAIHPSQVDIVGPVEKKT